MNDQVILVGFYEGEPVINRDEAEDWKWTAQDVVVEDIKQRPELYSYWFTLSLTEVLARMQKV